MKTIKTLSILCILVFGAISCKYEYGPNLSLRSKKARIEGNWYVKEIIDTDGFGKTYTFNLINDNTFFKDGSATYFGTEIGDNGSETEFFQNFNWEFTNSKNDLRWVQTNGDFRIFEILRLTNKEMWLKTKFTSDTAELRLMTTKNQ